MSSRSDDAAGRPLTQVLSGVLTQIVRSACHFDMAFCVLYCTICWPDVFRGKLNP